MSVGETLSSLVIVPVFVAGAPRVAFVGAEIVSVNVSLGSVSVSPVTRTSTVWEVEPAGIVTS